VITGVITEPPVGVGVRCARWPGSDQPRPAGKGRPAPRRPAPASLEGHRSRHGPRHRRPQQRLVIIVGTGLVLRSLTGTANGTRGYCDHNAPTAADTAWARLYLELGADPRAVRPILNPARRQDPR
jgi:hypothetical protein